MKYIHIARMFLSLGVAVCISTLSMESENTAAVGTDNPILALTDDAFILSAKNIVKKVGTKNFGILRHHRSLLEGLRAINMHDEDALTCYMYKPGLTSADRSGLIESATIFSELTNDNSYEKIVRGFFDKKGDFADFQYAIAQALIVGDRRYHCIKRYVYDRNLRIDKILTQNNEMVTALLRNHKTRNDGNVILYYSDFFLQHFNLATGTRTEPIPISENMAELAEYGFDVALLSEQQATDVAALLEANHMCFGRAKKIPMSDNYVLGMQHSWMSIINPLSCSIVFPMVGSGSIYDVGKNGTVLAANTKGIMVCDGEGKIQYEAPITIKPYSDKIFICDNGTVCHVQSDKCINMYDATMQNCIWKKEMEWPSAVLALGFGFGYLKYTDPKKFTIVDAEALSTCAIGLPCAGVSLLRSDQKIFSIRNQNVSHCIYDMRGNLKSVIAPLDYSNTKLDKLSDNKRYRLNTHITQHGFTTSSGQVGDAGWTTMLHLFKATPLKVCDLEAVSFWKNQSLSDQHILLDKITAQQRDRSYAFSSYDEEALFKKIPVSIQEDMHRSIRLKTQQDLLAEQQLNFTGCSVQ
jgi:hypothetical protein